MLWTITAFTSTVNLQWLAFNQRVLEEARDPGNPLLERVKFLAITANNLDEFVEIRVSSFLQKIEHGGQSISPDGLTPSEELDRLSASMHQFVREQYKCWNDELLPAIGKTFSVQEHLMNLARGFVNGSGRPGELHLGITDTGSEQVIAPSEAGQTVEPETQDSANATV